MTQTNTPSMRSRYRGCLIGGAVGDALGAPVEFMSLSQIRTAFGPAGISGFAPAYGRLGAITDEDARTFDVPLSFLTKGQKYVAEIYADGPGASWSENPLSVAISKRNVDSNTHLSVALAAGGGQAIRIRPAR